MDVIHMCKDERFFKPLLYMIQSVTNETKQLELLEKIFDCNFYFGVRIMYHTGHVDLYRNKIECQLKEKINRPFIEIDSVIPFVYAALMIDKDVIYTLLAEGYLIPMLQHTDDEATHEKLKIMYQSASKEKLIVFYTTLAKNDLNSYIYPNQLYGKCTESEEESIINLMKIMYRKYDPDVIDKILNIGFECSVKGVVPNIVPLKTANEITDNRSIYMRLYVKYNILYGEHISDDVLIKIIHSPKFNSNEQFYDFLADYSQRYQISDAILIIIMQQPKVASNKQLYDFLTDYSQHYQISDDSWTKIMRNRKVTSNKQFYDFLTDYSQRYPIPDDAIMTFVSVNCNFNNDENKCNSFNIFTDCNNQTEIAVQIRKSIKIMEFYNICRSKYHYNVAKFIIQNNDNIDSKKEYFKIMAHSNIYLAASVIDTMYYNSEEFEEIFETILNDKIDKTKTAYDKCKLNAIELQSIIASLLIIKKYDKFEAVMKDVFCPAICNNQKIFSNDNNSPLVFLRNRLTAEQLFIFICSMARNGAASKIEERLIVDYEPSDSEGLKDLMQTVFNTEFHNSTESVRLTIFMAKKYHIQNIEEVLGYTRDAIDLQIQKALCLENNINLLAYWLYRCPIENLNEDENNSLIQKCKLYGKNSWNMIKESIINNRSILSNEAAENLLLDMLKANSFHLETDCIPLLQNEKKITELLDRYPPRYTPCIKLKESKIIPDTDTCLMVTKFIFENYVNTYNIIKVYFSLLPIHLIPIEIFMNFMYEREDKNNGYLRHLLNDIIVSGEVKKVKSDSLYIFPKSFISIDNSLRVIWCNGKVRSDGTDVIPHRKDIVFCKIHSYNPEKNIVLLRCPAYTIEECKHYNSGGKQSEK